MRSVASVLCTERTRVRAGSRSLFGTPASTHFSILGCPSDDESNEPLCGRRLTSALGFDHRYIPFAQILGKLRLLFPGSLKIAASLIYYRYNVYCSV